MEEINNKVGSTDEIKRVQVKYLYGALIIGYIIGRLGSNKLIMESYKKGASDTLSSIIFKQ